MPTASPTTARRTPAGAGQTEAAPAPSSSDLQVGAADDAYERAADAVADQVVRRLAEAGELGHEHGAGCGHGSAPAAMGAEGGAVDASTADKIKASSGAPLPGAVRRSMEGAFGGADFGGVRLHTGAGAASLSKTLGATAFTVGQDVFLGSGAPSLDSSAGQRVLAHELAHTQQESTAVRRLGEGVPFRELTTGGATAIKLNGTASMAEAPGPAEGGGMLGDVAEGTTGLGGNTGEVGGVNDFHTDMDKARGVKEDDAGAAKTVGTTASTNALTHTGTALAGVEFIGAIAGLRGFFDANPGPQARIEAISAVTGASVGLADSIAKSVKTAEGGDSASAMTKTVAEVLGKVAAITKTLQAGYTVGKSIYEAVQSAKGLDAGEIDQKALVVVGALLESAKSIVETINTFQSAIGTVSAGMLSAVPALGIALSSIEIISAAINLGTSYYQWDKMQDDKRAAKEAFLGRKAAASTKWYSIGGHESAEAGANEALAKAKLTTASAADKVKAVAARRYLVAKELQYVNAKRIRRSVLNLSTGLLSLAGDIALLSGAGAAAGVGIKVAAGGTKAGAEVFRSLKKTEAGEKRKDTAYDMIIDDLSQRLVDAAMPVGAGLSGADRTKALKDQETEQTTVLRAIYATGISSRHLKATHEDNGKPGSGLYKVWISALKSRDGKG